MLKAKVLKVSRNVGSPLIDIEVEYFDDKDDSIKYQRVIQRDLSSNNNVKADQAAVEEEIQRIGREYLQTLSVEDDLKTKLEGREINIT